MNKFRNIPVNLGQPIPDSPQTLEKIGLDGGYRVDIPPSALPLEFSPDMLDMRFSNGGVEKDFGWRELTGAAASRILGLIEHKFIGENGLFHRLYRVTRNSSGKARLDVWDGTEWVLDIVSSEDLEDTLVSTISIQGVLLLADGKKILMRSESGVSVSASNDFLEGNSATAVGEAVYCTVNPAEAIGGDYVINYKVDASITFFSEGLEVVLSFEHEGEEFATRSYYVHSGTESWPHERLVVNMPISPGDEVAIKIKSITTNANPRSLALTDLAPPFLYGRQGIKGEGITGAGDRYTFEYLFDASGPSYVQCYYDNGSGWELGSEQFHFLGIGIRGTQTITAPLMVLGTRFRLVISPVDPSNFSATIHSVEVHWSEAVIAVNVHGFNSNEDPAAGIEYEVEGSLTGSFDVVSPDAPAARYLASFGNRAIALRDGTDTQSLAWSASGDVTDWVGEGSGQIWLVDARNDPIDDLMALTPVSSNFAALFRKRSIMRVFETGNIIQAIGAVHWIEGLGTESPFSPQIVPGGVIFLGHDLQVYYLTESGQTPIGTPIHQTLIDTLTSNVSLVDSAYDPVYGEYWLGVPEGGATHLNAVWVFDFMNFINTGGQQQRWRRKSISAFRLATASKV